MKKTLILLLAAALFSATLNAQQHLFLEEQELTLADGKVKAWVFPATGSQEETLEDFKDYLKERSDLKLKKEGDEMLIAEKVSLPAITTKRADLIGICTVKEQYYSMAIVIKLGYDISLSTAEWPSEMENFKHYVKAFMVYHYEQVYAQRIKDLEKKVKDSEKVLGQTEGNIENLDGKIGSNNKKISKETDAGKIGELEAENKTLEGEKTVLSNTLPDMVSQIDDLKTEIEENKTELNTYLSTISTF